jgi:uncharacterized membrane protein
MSATALFRLNWLLIGALLAASLAAWPTLPARIPVHFDLAGTPTRWAGATLVTWLGLPLFAAAMALFMEGAERLTRRAPALWNIPEKELFLRLSPPARAPIEAALARILGWCAVLVTATFAILQIAMYTTAVGSFRGAAPFLTVLAFLPMAALLWFAVREARRMGPLIRAAAGADERPSG